MSSSLIARWCVRPPTQYKDGPDIKIVSEYDQEIPQSQTADNPVAPRGRAAQKAFIRGLVPDACLRLGSPRLNLKCVNFKIIVSL